MRVHSMASCEGELLDRARQMIVQCGAPATWTAAIDNEKWHGGLDEYYYCDSCMNHEREGFDDGFGGERLPAPATRV